MSRKSSSHFKIEKPASHEQRYFNDFQALPEGALVADDRYYISRIKFEGPDFNIYDAEDLDPIFPCPNPECGYPQNSVDNASCALCDTSLDGVIAVHRRHQLFEYRQFSSVEVAARMAEKGLKHPGLFLHRYFVEKPYGELERYYLVLPDPMPILADQINVPQKTVRVLNWGTQLAEALAYLHQNKIGWDKISGRHIALRERKAMWVDFTATQDLPNDKALAIQQQEQNIVELVRVVHYLATGLEQYQIDTDLPPAAAEVFHRILGTPSTLNLNAEALAQAFRTAADAVRRPDTIRLRTGRATDVGMIRELNEDSLLTLVLDKVHRSINQPIGLFVVADGMGGHAAGDVASCLAVDTIAKKMATDMLVPHLLDSAETGKFDPKVWLTDAMQAANEAVFSYRDTTGSNLGTTLVVAVVTDAKAHVANIGDSRAYVINASDVHQITTDHSLVERLVSLGQITKAEARIHPQRNVIYRTIGDREDVEFDYFEQNLESGDKLLLCSDGLSGKIEDSEIHEIVQRFRSPQETCDKLVQAANERGGEDNVTAVIVQVQIS